MSELLESRWTETKDALLEGLDGNKKSVMAALTPSNISRQGSEWPYIILTAPHP